MTPKPRNEMVMMPNLQILFFILSIELWTHDYTSTEQPTF